MCYETKISSRVLKHETIQLHKTITNTILNICISEVGMEVKFLLLMEEETNKPIFLSSQHNIGLDWYLLGAPQTHNSLSS